ncbi:Na/Pi cotransporter family protein [Devosia sp. XJ19-1]|uniref:Na/Pi cotransporter family protein n=1 Tax=Devosia ureilytica TaxID=2952754 RepID=A0A9Q4AQM2_9HYPH|nr:Na/Pi cotransporter family protein [Devosia ureilytica]MCP8884422.1 Na/Pi cotransporter family protein [Devosia ureilytica]MCP8888030.1 Na/Pi cotransporter family protein [Devosia ureilytica]
MYFIIVQLVAAIVLLLWAVRMVRTAVERAYAAELKRTLGRAERSRFGAAAIGMALAIALQSSTAVAALAANFAGGGLISVATGLALMLGAYLGSAFVASILSFDLSLFTAPLIIIGGLLFLRGNERRTKQVGRMVLGIAFVLLSLEMVSEATAPWRDSDVLGVVVGYLRGDLWTSFAVAALITWLSYSSVASVLVIITFGTAGLIPIEIAAAFLLGANLGGTLIAFGMTRGGDVRARRIAAGALVMRGGAALLCLILLQVSQIHQSGLPGTVGQQASLLHILFNLGVLLAGLPLVRVIERLMAMIIKDLPLPGQSDIARLRRTALVADPQGNIDASLASATRELLRMSEMVEVMLQPVMEIVRSGDKAAIRRVKDLEPEVDGANRAIKLFLTRLNWDNMDADQARRASDLSTFAISLEQAGDIVARQLLRVADQKSERRIAFSAQGWQELTDLHARVLANMQLALNVLVSEDAESARQLVAEKDEVGLMERASMEKHFARLRSGDPNSFETSELHLETMHALRRINSLLTGIAYSILSEQGELLPTKLVADKL